MNLSIPPMDVHNTTLISRNLSCDLNCFLLGVKATRDPDITGFANCPFFAPRHNMQACGAHDLTSGIVWKLLTTMYTGRHTYAANILPGIRDPADADRHIDPDLSEPQQISIANRMPSNPRVP